MPDAQRGPAPSLRGYVRRYYGWEETSESSVRRCEGPGTDVLLVLSFGSEWRIGSAPQPEGRWQSHNSFTAGLHQAAVLTEHDGYSHGMQVSLSPPGAHALLGNPMAELADRTVDLEDVLGRQARELPELLSAVGTWSERFRLLDSVLKARLVDATPPSKPVVWAWSRLTQTRGRVPVGELVAELGWSRKRMAARFREEIGLAPKSLARLLRFEYARMLLARGDLSSLAQIAYDSGYYDQSHLSTEVHRITGMTPATYRASLRGETNLQDAAALPH